MSLDDLVHEPNPDSTEDAVRCRKRSLMVSKQPCMYPDCSAISLSVCTGNEESTVPLIYEQGMNSQHVDAQNEAIETELAEINGNKKWALVPLPPGEKPAGKNCMFTNKYHKNVVLIHRRAILVAKFFTQRCAIDCRKIFPCSPLRIIASTFSNCCRSRSRVFTT